MKAQTVTNLLLAVVCVLLLANLAVPVLEGDPPPPPASSAPERPLLERVVDLEAKIGRIGEDVERLSRWNAVGYEGADTIRVRVEDLGVSPAKLRLFLDELAKAATEEEPGGRGGGGNELAVVATLRNMSSAQAQFQATSKADLDNDGTGEFGAFRELSGEENVRGLAQVGRLNPPVLSGAFKRPDLRGVITRFGYRLVIYLPDDRGNGVCCDQAGYDRIDADLAETTWCAYAWPEQGRSGTRTFFVNQTGDVLSTESASYSGSYPPRPGAAFKDGGLERITGLAAPSAEAETGQDGNVWKQVN